MVNYFVIPKTSKVDNVTLEQNARGEIQIKGGAITEDLFSKGIYAESGEDVIYNDDTKRTITGTSVYQVVNQVKINSSYEGSIDSLDFEFQLEELSAGYLWYKVFKNSVEIVGATSIPGTAIKRHSVTNLIANDIVSVKVISSSPPMDISCNFLKAYGSLKKNFTVSQLTPIQDNN